MLFKFLAASIAISAVAAVPVHRGRSEEQNKDDHSLDARKDKDLAQRIKALSPTLHEEATHEGEVVALAESVLGADGNMRYADKPTCDGDLVAYYRKPTYGAANPWGSRNYWECEPISPPPSPRPPPSPSPPPCDGEYKHQTVWGGDSGWKCMDPPSLPPPPSPSFLPGAGTFSITGGHRSKYCCDEGDGGVKCNRGGVHGWEKFTVEPLDDGKYAIKGGREGKYCCDDNHFVCNRDSPGGAWERFTLEDLGGGKYAIKGGRNGKYCKDNHDHAIRCDADAIGEWETFTFASA